MKAKRIEEALDECLSAYLEGRRTIEESLSLYPDLRPQLEPLLRTALDVAETLDEASPQPHIQERGRRDFLENASARRKTAAQAEELRLSRRLARAAGGRGRLALAAAAVALAFGAVAVATTLLESPSADPTRQAQFLPAPVISPAVGDLRQTQEELRVQAVEGGEVSPAVIRELAEKTADLDSLVTQYSALDSQSRLELERAIGYQFLLLRLIVDEQPAAAIAPEARQALDLTEQLAEEWGVELPPVPSSAAASPSASPTATPSPAADGTATPSPPAATPTPAPSPSPAP